MTELNFEQDTAIDLDNLHEEWQTHAQKRYAYAKEVSYHEKVVKKAHEKIKVVRSQLIRECKLEFKSYTAQQTEGYYREHPDHKAAKDEMTEAEYDLSMAWNALRAMDDKKFALENEVELWKRDYFSTPRERRDVEPGKPIMTTDKDDITKRNRAAINKKKRKRRQI